MNSKRRPCSRFALATGAALALVLGAVPAAEPDPVGLRWALGAFDGTGAPTAIQRDTKLEAGTRLKFLVEPLSEQSVYLILLDSSDAIHVLYRSQGDGRDRTYVPAGNRQYFELDAEPGQETFFLLASAEPLTELDALLARHEAASEEARAALSGGIVAEIRRLHKAHRNFARYVEKPSMIGGQTRASSDGLDDLAVDVEAPGFFSKTITIGH